MPAEHISTKAGAIPILSRRAFSHLEIKKRTFWRKIRPEINAINHSPFNVPPCGNELFTTIGKNRVVSTQRPGLLHTSCERNRGKWTKIGAKRGATRPKSALPPPAKASPFVALRKGMRVAHYASPQHHPLRCGHRIVKHTDLSLGRSRLALRKAWMTRPRRAGLATAKGERSAKPRQNGRRVARDSAEGTTPHPPSSRPSASRDPGS